MLKSRPKFERRQLQGPNEAGRLAHVNGQLAIISVSAQDPNKQLTIASFDPATKAFVHRTYRGESALVFNGELVFKPDLSDPITEAHPAFTSASDVFFDGSEMYVVVQLLNGFDWRLVTLGTGIIVQWKGELMHAFRRYQLGVEDVDGETRWLLSV